MDTSEQYIHQCDCPEIQEGWRYKAGDYYFVLFGDSPSKEYFFTQSIISVLGEQEDIPRKNVVKLAWLPRQDQIQELLIGKIGPSWRDVSDLIDRFNDWYYFQGMDTELTSMEKVWLAFYMKENGKVWNGKEWVNE